MSRKTIQATKNYRLFERHSGENRPLDLRKHKKLMDSMKLYGFLPCFPIVVVRNTDGNLIVKDGQHRLLIAEELELPVYWVEEATDFDVAVVNSTAKIWGLKDYAQKHAANGLKAYTEGLEFASSHSLPVGIAFALLSGTTSFGNCEQPFINGTWRIKDRAWADSVAGIYGPIGTMSPPLRKSTFLLACMAVCRVDGFDPARLLANADRCREKLVSYSTRDSYLEMLESVYNFGRKQLVALKNLAVMAMRERNTVENAKKKTVKKELAVA